MHNIVSLLIRSNIGKHGTRPDFITSPRLCLSSQCIDLKDKAMLGISVSKTLLWLFTICDRLHHSGKNTARVVGVPDHSRPDSRAFCPATVSTIPGDGTLEDPSRSQLKRPLSLQEYSSVTATILLDYFFFPMRNLLLGQERVWMIWAQHTVLVREQFLKEPQGFAQHTLLVREQFLEEPQSFASVAG
jgi:hypothetical protein